MHKKGIENQMKARSVQVIVSAFVFSACSGGNSDHDSHETSEVIQIGPHTQSGNFPIVGDAQAVQVPQNVTREEAYLNSNYDVQTQMQLGNCYSEAQFSTLGLGPMGDLLNFSLSLSSSSGTRSMCLVEHQGQTTLYVPAGEKVQANIEDVAERTANYFVVQAYPINADTSSGVNTYQTIESTLENIEGYITTLIYSEIGLDGTYLVRVNMRELQMQ